MAGKDRKPTGDDAALWKAVTRNVTPNPERNRAECGPATPRAKPGPQPKPQKAAARAEATAPKQVLSEAAAASPRLDPIARRTARRLKSGRIEIDGKIDLHGLSQDAAHAALFRFIPAASAAGKTNVLVVTGKGKGILQNAVPMWLSSGRLAEYVISMSTAPQSLGGAGALYVVLRKVTRERGR